MASGEISLRAAYAQSILDKHLTEKLNAQKHEDIFALPERPSPEQPVPDGPYEGRIGIIGAGAAGLYAAMMLKFVGITNVDILEASHRSGGRIYTQSLPGKDRIEHPYYDVGAMRIPDNRWMKSVTGLIEYMNDEPECSDLKLENYVYDNPSTPVSYYYKHDRVDSDKFTNFMTRILERFDFKDKFKTAYGDWMETANDNYSTKGFLMGGPQSGGAPNPPFSYEDVAAAELSDTGTGLFDESFTETVLHYVEFVGAKDKKWWRVEGGMQRMTDAMEKLLSSSSWPKPESSSVKVTKNSPVVAMTDRPDAKKIDVTIAGREKAESYDMVFNTTAMGPLQKMDIQGLALPDNILSGIRSLGYDRSTKVAIRFKKQWWNTNEDPKSIYGGVSGCDLPIRTVVYPSWNDGPDKSAVLMVSYTWSQDATRMASIVPDYEVVEPKKSDPIVTLCLQNLVKLWSGSANPPTFEMLSDMYESHHAWAWSHDPWTGGAFALFAPGQFKNVYPLFREHFCKGKFAMCGEALSAHHAWIAGAFDSAYQTVIMFLEGQGRVNEVETLRKSIFGDGRGNHVEEMNMKQVKWALTLGDGPEDWNL